MEEELIVSQVTNTRVHIDSTTSSCVWPKWGCNRSKQQTARNTTYMSPIMIVWVIIRLIVHIFLNGNINVALSCTPSNKILIVKSVPIYKVFKFESNVTLVLLKYYCIQVKMNTSWLITAYSPHYIHQIVINLPIHVAIYNISYTLTHANYHKHKYKIPTICGNPKKWQIIPLFWLQITFPHQTKRKLRNTTKKNKKIYANVIHWQIHNYNDYQQLNVFFGCFYPIFSWL